MLWLGLLLAVCWLTSCTEAQAADGTGPEAFHQALGLMGAGVVALAGVALAWGRLMEAIGRWAWVLVRDHATPTTDALAERLDALEERSGRHDRALYGDEHQGGILERVRAMQEQQEATLQHLGQLRRDAIEASDRHTVALRELVDQLRRGAD